MTDNVIAGIFAGGIVNELSARASAYDALVAPGGVQDVLKNAGVDSANAMLAEVAIRAFALDTRNAASAKFKEQAGVFTKTFG